MKFTLTRVLPLAAVGLGVCLALSSCERLVITEAELNERIYKEVPPGSTKEQVVKFLDSLEIRGRRPKRYHYKPYEYTFTREGKEVKVAGSIFAVFPDAGAWIFPGDASRGVIFEFDGSGRLVNYIIENFGN
ncbi:MAG TPA: hypothetical protein VIP46_11040 [Pyrinomonadaceae bacterium]